MSDQASTQSQTAIPGYASNPDNASAGPISGAHYSSAHNGYVKDSPARVFYRSDYRNAARLIQSLRHVKGDPYTAKDDVTKIDALASMLAVVFEGDHAGFDAEKFLAGTQLPPAPEALPESPADGQGSTDTI